MCMYFFIKRMPTSVWLFPSLPYIKSLLIYIAEYSLTHHNMRALLKGEKKCDIQAAELQSLGLDMGKGPMRQPCLHVTHASLSWSCPTPRQKGTNSSQTQTKGTGPKQTAACLELYQGFTGQSS